MLDADCFLKRYFLNSRICCAIWRRSLRLSCAALALLAFSTSSVVAESCATSSDMDEATRAALMAAGARYFNLIGKGDAAALRQSAIPSLASDFSEIETTIKDNQAALAGSKGAARPQSDSVEPAAALFSGAKVRHGTALSSR